MRRSLLIKKGLIWVRLTYNDRCSVCYLDTLAHNRELPSLSFVSSVSGVPEAVCGAERSVLVFRSRLSAFLYRRLTLSPCAAGGKNCTEKSLLRQIDSTVACR